MFNLLTLNDAFCRRKQTQARNLGFQSDDKLVLESSDWTKSCSKASRRKKKREREKKRERKHWAPVLRARFTAGVKHFTLGKILATLTKGPDVIYVGTSRAVLLAAPASREVFTPGFCLGNKINCGTEREGWYGTQTWKHRREKHGLCVLLGLVHVFKHKRCDTRSIRHIRCKRLIASLGVKRDFFFHSDLYTLGQMGVLVKGILDEWHPQL